MDKKVESPEYNYSASDNPEAPGSRTGCGDVLVRLELAVQQACEGLARWQEGCFGQVSGVALTGAEITLMLLIGSGSRSKTIKELARSTNRTDIPNIQYSLRKLASAGFTRKQGAGRSGVTYSLTAEGERVSNEMRSFREGALLQPLKASPELCERLETAAAALEALTGVYGSAVRDTEARGSI